MLALLASWDYFNKYLHTMNDASFFSHEFMNNVMWPLLIKSCWHDSPELCEIFALLCYYPYFQEQLGEEFFALEIADRYHAVKKMRPNTLASQLSAPPCF